MIKSLDEQSQDLKNELASIRNTLKILKKELNENKNKFENLNFSIPPKPSFLQRMSGLFL